MMMDIGKIVEPLSPYFPAATLHEHIRNLVELAPEPPISALPSIVISDDGLTLTSLLLTTEHYLVELHLEEAARAFDVDFAAKNLILNYRIRTWTHEIKEEEQVKATFSMAQIDLIHDTSAPGLRTILSFAGTEEGRVAWLKSVFQALPIELLLA